jgi:hypothetical protein
MTDLTEAALRAWELDDVVPEQGPAKYRVIWPSGWVIARDNFRSRAIMIGGSTRAIQVHSAR